MFYFTSLTRFCGDKVGGLGLEVLDDDVVVEDGLGVVGHLRQQVAVEHHLAVVEVEASHLIDKGSSMRESEGYEESISLSLFKVCLRRR